LPELVAERASDWQHVTLHSLEGWFADWEGSGSGLLEVLCVRREKSREQRRDGDSGTYRRQALGATSVRHRYFGEKVLLRWDGATSMRRRYFGETALFRWDGATSVRRRYFDETPLHRMRRLYFGETALLHW